MPTVETVDLTPTWREILPLLFHLFESGSDEQREMAESEFEKMAGAADRYIALAKAGRIKAEGN